MQPDFTNLEKVLRRDVPDRPTLFEFFLNDALYDRLAGNGDLDPMLKRIRAFYNAGYDYVTLSLPGFTFPTEGAEQAETRSINEGVVINDRQSFDAYNWPDPDEADYDFIDKAGAHLPKGMKFIVFGPNGVLENVVDLVGYQNLCLLLVDDEQLVLDIFEAVGSRLARFYETVARHEMVGACISNDDWGFKTQTMLSVPDMRRFVFPWHREITRKIHAAGKPAILHSCGYFEDIIEDIVEDMAYEGRHSYEDTILPVEEAYEAYHNRIAIMGGIDMDFVARATPEEVYERSRRMLRRAADRGGFALGTGNSVPEYIPDDNYFAMLRAALDLRSA